MASTIALIDPDHCASLGLKVNRAVMTSHNLKRDILVILSIKMSIVILASLFVFGSRQRPQVDIDALRHRILTDSQAASRRLVQ
jgi:hypothetical protein